MTMSRKKTRTKTTIGSRLALLALLTLLFALPVPAKDKKIQQLAAPTAIIAGTVFRTPGFALPGAEVVITPEKSSDGTNKFKKEKVLTDARGEFAVRVPPVPMGYTVDVKLNRYEPQSKTVAIEGEQRKELSFELVPVAK